MADDIPLTKRSLTVESKEVRHNDWNETTFFPFQEDHERHQVTLDHHAASFPKLGIGALIGALTLIALSAGILMVIQGPGRVVSDWTVHVYKTHRYVTIPKPAAWLSGILSAISVSFHIALSEGLNIAWWYHVRQENATVRDLHDIWGHGTSTWTVVKSGANDFKNGVVGLSRKATNRSAQDQPYSQRKHFSYVALATLFVATIPLNGFLLQNAVIVEPVPATTNASIKVPMLNADNFLSLSSPYVASATADGGGGGGVTDWSPMLGKLSQVVTSKTSAIADLASYNTTCLGSCKTSVQGIGFKIHCNEALQSYSIPPSSCDSSNENLTEMWTTGADVLKVAVTYDFFGNKNRVTLKTLWKDSSKCSGNYSTQTCSLDLATVEYPVVINSGVKEATATGLRKTTIMTLDMDLLKETPKVKSLAQSPYELTSYSYNVPGLAGLFAQTTNSTVNLRYNNDTHAGNGGCNSVSVQGLFAQQQLATRSTIFDGSGNGPICSGTFQNVTAQALASIQSMMFQLGAYNWLSSFGDASAGYTADWVAQNTPTPMAVQTFQQNQYRVVWAWYFGSMAVTIVVSLFILPTFWGYWRLERKTTMSPFETARAFHAPVLYQEDSTVRSEDLIKRLGDVQIHRDLPVVPAPIPPSRVGTGDA